MRKVAIAFGALALLAGSALAQDNSFTIGVSNGWVGSEWRTQMIEEAQAAAAAWKEKGVDVELIVQSNDVDVQGQIGHVRNFINQGVDAIIINPNSPTAFDPVFAQAKAAGILVVATDAEVSSPDAIYVGIDQKDWGRKGGEWLAKAIGGKGNVVAINGVAGHPANQMRVEGYREALAAHPEIKILNETNADWDQAKGQQAMQNLLATYPDIQGVFVQDGMAAGAWRAITAAGKKDQIASTGEIRKDFLELWSTEKLNTGSSVNPPGVMASALNVAVHRLMGKEFKDGVFGGVYGNSIFIPIPTVTSENFAEAQKQAEGKPGHWAVTHSLTIDEAAEFFN